ncbi:MAG: family 1 glycosylhydrolase [Sandaracinus sp.]|nr:family 1 glycosylhydrolase [Sandaracinus sp.]MCB9618606.1 family 1 glycosylhydrolase [Sandaracinus sp.]MCB9630739.1 family 1 glycosylhydrolase [Sandaracinus sp.]
MRSLRLLSVLLLLSCGGDDGPAAIRFPEAGPVGGEAGRGSFTFGVATAAAQIEDDNDASDWYAYTAPTDMGGLGNGVFVGDAVRGFSRQVEDNALVAEMNLDSYRFNPSWARIEPTRDAIDADAVAHYGRVLDDLVARGIKPMMTVHHFSSPVWVDDPRRVGVACPDGPTDTDLCGWTDPEGSAQVIEEIAEFAGLLAREYGDRIDEWCTLNEPVNYLLASYGLNQFPPGRNLILAEGGFGRLVDAMRAYIAAHAAIYDAILANDTVDADGDGEPAIVGMTLSVAAWVPAARNRLSTAPADVEATDAVEYVYHHLFVDSIRNGGFDADLDGTAEEMHPDWSGKLDFLGVQYYFRTGVTGTPGLLPVIEATPCFGEFDFGACLAPVNDDETKRVPAMGYEFWEPGIYEVLKDFSSRWPDLPLSVTESGLATEVGRRRAEHVVRSLEQIWLAREEGVDVRGYYHWSLIDNFEWAEGYEPRFGLYRVNLDTYERTATEGAVTLGEIAGQRRLTSAQRRDLGGVGPMTPEPPHGE